jgi:hypothetical protein
VVINGNKKKAARLAALRVVDKALRRGLPPDPPAAPAEVMRLASATFG